MKQRYILAFLASAFCISPVMAATEKPSPAGAGAGAGTAARSEDDLDSDFMELVTEARPLTLTPSSITLDLDTSSKTAIARALHWAYLNPADDVQEWIDKNIKQEKRPASDSLIDPSPFANTALEQAFPDLKNQIICAMRLVRGDIKPTIKTVNGIKKKLDAIFKSQLMTATSGVIDAMKNIPRDTPTLPGLIAAIAAGKK